MSERTSRKTSATAGGWGPEGADKRSGEWELNASKTREESRGVYSQLI